MKRTVGRVAWAVALGFLATALWLLLTPATEVAARGRLGAFVLARGTSNAALGRMWLLQLPGTALACCLYSLATIRSARSGRPAWGTGGALGAALGGSVGLLFFASPPPGFATYIWGATFYMTGIPTLMMIEALPESLASHAALLALVENLRVIWPIVVTAVLTSICTLAGGLLGQWSLSCGKGLQNNALQLTSGAARMDAARS